MVWLIYCKLSPIRYDPYFLLVRVEWHSIVTIVVSFSYVYRSIHEWWAKSHPDEVRYWVPFLTLFATLTQCSLFFHVYSHSIPLLFYAPTQQQAQWELPNALGEKGARVAARSARENEHPLELCYRPTPTSLHHDLAAAVEAMLRFFPFSRLSSDGASIVGSALSPGNLVSRTAGFCARVPFASVPFRSLEEAVWSEGKVRKAKKG